MFQAACSLLVALSIFSTAEAKIFRNAYVSFELPPNWNCNLEGTEWVCTSQFNKNAKEAIIILTAKEVGPTDSLGAYESHLKTPRTIPSASGRPVTSKVYHVRQIRVSDAVWIDGLHLGSEVASYFTRYLATIKNKIAILVTFSAHKEHYTKYSKDFFKAIKSLRVVASKDLLAGAPAMPGADRGVIGPPPGGMLPMDAMSGDFPEEESSSSSSSGMLFGLALLLGAIGYYLLRQRRNKAGRKKSRSSAPPPSQRPPSKKR